MLTAAFRAAPAGDAAPDWIAIGLVFSVVGAFLLGNAILLRNPRALVEEHFRRRREGPTRRLGAIREHVFQRAQIAVGFTYLVGGFALQLLGRYRPALPRDGVPEVPAAWVGVIVASTIAFLAAAWLWARHAFRRHVRAHLRSAPPDFEGDLPLAREVGELFGVGSEKDDTVQSYLERLHAAIGIPAPERRSLRPIPLPRLEELEVEEG